MYIQPVAAILMAAPVTLKRLRYSGFLWRTLRVDWINAPPAAISVASWTPITWSAAKFIMNDSDIVMTWVPCARGTGTVTLIADARQDSSRKRRNRAGSSICANTADTPSNTRPDVTTVVT